MKLLLLLAVLQVIACSCPYGFVFNPEGDCSGNYTRITAPWDYEMTAKAVEICEGILGQPIIIHSEQDQNFWRSRIRQNDYSVIGITCNTTSTLWEWVDGSRVDYKPASGNYNPDLDKACNANNKFVWRTRGSDGYWTAGTNSSTYTTDVFCTVPLRQPVPSDDGCDGFEDDKDDGICYQIGTTAESWNDAQLICSKLGSNLASIHSDQENSFIRRLAVSKGAVNGLFLGATLSGKGKDFGWIDGTEWDYANFYPGFPMAGVGDCLAMDTSTPSGQWMNKNCASKLPVICARAQRTDLPPTCSPGPSVEEKLITTPGFPFSASTPCDFFLTAEEGKKVEAEILFLEANPCCDFLVIHDDFIGGNLIANITGEIRNVTYTSTTNLLRISWQPNGGVNVRGMAMTYRQVP